MTTEIAKRPEYDSARLLTYFAVFLVSLVFIYLAAVVGWQLAQTGKVETGTWGQLCLVIGWALSKASDVYGNRFNTTAQSKAKDATIAQQARTNAAAQDALLDPAVSVVIDPTKQRPPARADGSLLSDPHATISEVPAAQSTNEVKP